MYCLPALKDSISGTAVQSPGLPSAFSGGQAEQKKGGLQAAL